LAAVPLCSIPVGAIRITTGKIMVAKQLVVAVLKPTPKVSIPAGVNRQ
jgi:hypothetical protein